MTFRKSNLPKAVLLAILGLGLAGLAVGAADDPVRQAPANSGEYNVYEAFTVPSKRSELTLRIPHVVLKSYFKPGDHVKAGDLLVQEDDRVEAVKLQGLRVQANSVVAVKSAETKRDYDQSDLKRIQEMHRRKVATDSELEKATAQVEIDKWEIEDAREKQVQYGLQLQEQEALLKQMRILAPHDGIIEQIIKEGEVVDPQKPAVVLVQNNPVWVEVYLSTKDSLRLVQQQQKNPAQPVTVLVRLVNPEEPPLVKEQAAKFPAKLIFVAPTAEPATSTHLVRLEMDNATGMPSGLKAEVLVAKTEPGKVAER